MMAETPTDRQEIFVRRIVEARSGDESVGFETGAGVEIEYANRVLQLELTPEERDRLAELLEAYRVFKIKQPETRKAADGVVYVSALTDPKHAADFIEALFRDVYELPEGYELRD